MTLQQALNHFKTKAAIAQALGVHKTTVSNWGDEIPLGRQAELELRTNGKLKADLPRASA